MGNLSILIVEDEQRVADLLKRQLQQAGFDSEIAYDGYIGRQMAATKKYNLIILDINLPLVNGYDLCKEIRKTSINTPIIMLTAFGTSDNKIAGFDAGADDYVVKPYEFRELLARINVSLRHSVLEHESPEILRIADLIMDMQTRRVTRGSRKIELTAKESLLLETFLRNKDKLLSREFIIEHVWDLDFDPNTNVNDVYVNYLKNKIDKDFTPRLIHTKFGFGYYFSEKEI